MKFELNLLENSYDYINSSFDLYEVANEYGVHDKEKSSFENKVKWKLAFVTMVQAFELLLKESLFRINENLVYDDIDCEKANQRKTVTFQQAINRINNFSNNVIGLENKEFLIKCSHIRNKFIHYKVDIQSEKIKSKYCTLYTIYKEIHNKLMDDDIKFYKDNGKLIEDRILEYNKDWVIFRGVEVRKNYVKGLTKDIEINSKYKYYITQNGEKIERVRYGDELSRMSEEFKKRYNISSYTNYEICDDCGAKIGEFHLNNCDIEICPICFGQAITCECIAKNENGDLIVATD
ncbi:hypothetical protein [Clostridium aciditolerans]|uniref:Uncharacterized protein n=1 Tax=Clostridium aciditolerans TaxID=339861 RepID=A0A934I3I7_9CLOT|nr:hypothetical protein [Clostridium aciditolerans]MBI6875618.1 hypothetical protein [Clostridium aciditolerans]